MNDAVWRFARDLSDAGMSARQRAVLALLYERALTSGSAASWERLYRALFSALRRLAHEPSAFTRQSLAAVDSLLRIVQDDLGSRLFGATALSQLLGCGYGLSLKTVPQPALFVQPPLPPASVVP